MTVQIKDLLAGQPIDQLGNLPSAELVEIIQRLVEAVRDHETRLTTLEP